MSAPKLRPPPPQDAPTDPFQAFGQPAMWIAAFGSLFTRRPLVAAINAAGEVLKSTHEQDLTAAKRNYETWKVESENAVKMAKFEQDAYKAAVSRYRADATAGEAEIKVLGSAFKNAALESVYSSEGMPGVVKYLGKHGTDSSILSERQLRLSEMMEKHVDQLSATQAWDATHPAPQDPAARDQWMLQRSLAHTMIRAGKDPDEIKGGAAGAGEHDVEILAKDEFKQREGRDPTSDDAAAMAKIRQEQRGVAAAGKDEAKSIGSDAANLAADRIIAGDYQAAVGMGRNAANMKKINDAVAQRAKDQGLSGADIAARVAEYHGMVAAETTTGRRSATVELPAAEAQKIIPLVLDASEKVDRTQYSSMNSVIQAAEKGSGDTNVVNLAQGVNSLINVYSRVISPTGTPTVSDKDHARDILSAAWSKGQFRSAIGFMQKEIEAARAAPPEVKRALHDNFTGAKSGGPKDGDTGTSKSGKPTVYRDGAWHYAE